MKSPSNVPKLGEVADLRGIKNKLSRRRVLKALGAAGMTTGGLTEAMTKVYGEEPEGVPLVWTRDKYGNPDRVRFIPEERYRRLKVYEKLNPHKFIGQHPVVNEISITQQSADETDLALVLYVDENTASVSSELPDQIQGVPTVIEERPTDFTPKSCDTTTSKCAANDVDNSCRVGEHFTTMVGNIEISNGNARGTLGLVAFNSDSNNPYKVLITADHVMESASYMYQPPDGRIVGHFDLADSSMDATRYRIDSDVDGNVGETAEDSQETISGAWTFSGLSDATSGRETVSCSYAGAQTCYCPTKCDSTSKNDAVTYEADMIEVVTEFGDSGGPFVDGNGKLVCTLTGCQEANGVYWDRGPVGQEMLDSVNSQLYDPRIQ